MTGQSLQERHFQVRHREMGVFQGECMGMGFWHPLSDMPEQGYCEFPSREAAEAYIEFLCSDRCSDPLSRADLSIEPYDFMTSEAMRSAFADRYKEVGKP